MAGSFLADPRDAKIAELERELEENLAVSISSIKRQNATLTEQHQQDKRHLDAIAEALHPHKPAFTEERWTYQPDQLAGMVRELHATARGVAELRDLARKQRDEALEQLAAARADGERLLKAAIAYTSTYGVGNPFLDEIREAIDQARANADREKQG